MSQETLTKKRFVISKSLIGKNVLITFTNKKHYKINENQYNLSFPIKNLDYPNIETSEDLKFSFSI